MPLNIQGKVVGLEESIRRVEQRFNRIGGGLKVRINEKEFTQPLGKITHSANEFSKSLEASNARVIAFGASAAIIGGVTLAFKELVVQSIKFEKILTDINVVLGTTSSNLNKFGKNLFNVARNTSQAIDVVAEAALEFSRQGLSMEETLRRTNDALILVRLTGMKAADAVSGLTAAMNGFADAGLSTTNIINKLAAVDVKFAVSADDLVNALARAGAVAQDAGVSFDQLIGAVTSAQQITARGGAVIGNSFKTIFTRVQRSSTIDRLQELGVAVRDIRGSTLPALTVLKNLSTQYDKLADTTKAAVAEQVGGVFQINILKAALKDLNRENSLYAQATDISANATNQAQIKNEQLQKTLSSLATQTSLTVQELSANIGELALSPGISKLLDAINSAGEALNSLFGKDSEGFGSDVAKGLVKGIGAAITGPGMVVAIGIFAKLFKNALSFSKDSLKDVLGIVTAKDREKQIQEDIVTAMNNNKQLASELDRLSHDKVAQEELILKAINAQSTALERQQSIASGIAPGLVAKGVKPGLTMGKKKASAGLIPEDVISERMGALSGGYAPGAVKTMKVQGLGQVVYNGAETVKNFKGMSQPAIMPPQHSRAGSTYQKDFQQKHGFDPYAFGGLVPNFALQAQKFGNILRLPKAKMFVETTPQEGQVRKQGWHPITVGLKTLSSRAGAPSYKPYFDTLQKMGITQLQRYFYFTSQNPDIAKGKFSDINKKLTNKQSGDVLEKNLQTSLKGKGYLNTSKHQTAKVDFIAPGRMPLEAKSGSTQNSKLMAKSIKLYSDKYIEQFLQNAGKGDLSDKMQKKKLKDSLRTAKNVFKSSAGPSDVKTLGLSNGLIPNFANPLVQAVAREKAAGVPSALIRVGQDSSLISPDNPMGLGVTNTRDEPLGIKQGIRRARSMGLDPQTHGASGGLIPNFNKVKSKKSDEKMGEASGNLMMGMFALTSATYALEGALSDSESAFAQGTKVVNGFIMGASQGAMVFSGLNDVGKSLTDSQSKFAKSIGGPLLRSLGAIGGIAALAVPAFQAIKENTTLLDTSLDTLRKSAEQTSKGLEGLNNAISITNDLEASKKELTELTNSSLIDTFDGQLKRMDLETKIANQQTELSKVSETLSKNLNLSANELQTMTSGTAEGMKKLQESMLLYSQQLQSNTLAQSRIAARQNPGDFLESLQNRFIDPLVNFDMTSFLSRIATATQFGSSNLGFAAELTGAKDPTSATTTVNQKALERSNIMAARAFSNSGVATEMMDMYQGGFAQNLSGEFDLKSFNDVFSRLETRVTEGLKSSDPKQQQAAVILSQQMEGVDQDSDPEVKLGFMEDMNKIFNQYIPKFKKQEEKRIKDSEDGLALFKKIKTYRQETARLTELSTIEAANALALQKSSNELAMQVVEYNNKYADALGILTKDQMVSTDLNSKLAKADLDLLNAKQKLLNDYDQESKKYISDLFSAKSIAGGQVLGSKYSSSIDPETSEDIFPKSQKKLLSSLKSMNRKGKYQGIDQLISDLQSPDIQNQEAIGSRLQKHFSGLGGEEAAKQIESMQARGIVINEEVLADLGHMRNKYKQANENLEKQNTQTKQGIKASQKSAELQAGTLSYHRQRLSDLKKSTADIKRVADYNAQNAAVKARGDLLEIEAQNELLKNKMHLDTLVDGEVLSREKALALTERSLIIERALVEDKEKLRKLVADQVRQEEEKADIARIQERETHSQKMSQGIYGKEASRARESNLEQMQGKSQALASDVNFYAGQGNTIRHAESMTEYAKHQKDLNIEMNTGTLFADSLAVKIAEANEELSKFGETLANTTFDATKEAFKGLVASMSDGTKSMSDAMLQFVGTIAGRIHEKLLDRAATQITTAIFEMSGLADNGLYKGGMVQGYANGGITSSHSRQVPSMLTSGEYVVRKKVVDKLGKGALDSINESGSLEDLFEKPNDDLFDITSEGAAMVPAIMRSPESLGIASSGSAYIGSSDKSENKLDTSESDSIIGKFASIVDSFGSKLAAFRYGGGVQANTGDAMEDDLIKSANKQLKRKESFEKLAKGAGYIAGSSVAAYQNRESTGPEAPTAPVHQMLNTRSRLNLDSRTAPMSAKFRATDQYSQDYGQYLLDKYEYDVQQKNAKVQRRAQVAQTLASIPMSIMLGGIMGKGSKMISHKVDSMVENHKTNKMLKTFEQDAMSFDASKSSTSSSPSSPKSIKSSISSALGYNSQTTQQFHDFQRNNSNPKQPLSQSLQNSVSHMQTSNQSSNVDYSKTHGSNLLNSYVSHQSKNQSASTFNQGKQYVHNLLQRNNQGGLINSIANSNVAYNSNKKDSQNNYSNSPFSFYNKNNSNSSNISENNPYSYFYRGGNVNSSASKMRAFSYFNQGGNVSFASNVNPYSYFYRGGNVNSSSFNPYSYFNRGGSVNMSSAHSNPYSYFYRGGSVNSSSSSSNPYSYFNRGGVVNMSHFNQGGSVASTSYNSSPYSYFNSGGIANVNSSNYSPSFNSSSSTSSRVRAFSSGGKVYGPGGIDKVGPVLLDKGEYVIKASSVNKVEKKYPGFFDRLNSMKMKDGGLVDSGSSSTDITNQESNESSSSNVTVNINVSSGGNTSIDGGDGNQQAFAAKVKDAVLGVISQEKRVGGMLRGR